MHATSLRVWRLALVGSVGLLAGGAAVVGYQTVPSFGLPAGAVSWPGVELWGVSCPTATACTAVGDAGDRGVIVTDTAGRWRFRTVESASGAGSSIGLIDDWCVPTGHCVTVVNVNDTALDVARFSTTGSDRWTLDTVDPAERNVDLYDVATCSSIDACWTFASSDNTTNDRSASIALGETDGHWLRPTVLGDGYSLNGSTISAVTCWARDSCAIVGDVVGNTTGHWFIQFERHGRWTAPRVDPSRGGFLAVVGFDHQIACTGADSCVIGGEGVVGSHGVGVVDQEVGGRWRPAARGLGMGTGAVQSVVMDVGCFSSATCVAAGRSFRTGYRNAAFVQAEVDGRWARPLIVPTGTGGFSVPQAASCPVAHACIVVGSLFALDGQVESYVATLSHSTWHWEVLNAGPPGAQTVVTNVACVTTACHVVGYVRTGASTSGFVFPIELTS